MGIRTVSRIAQRRAGFTLVELLLVTVLLLMMAFVRRDWGFRILRVASRRDSRKPPEQMV